MTEAMPFLQKYDITFLRPLPILAGRFFLQKGKGCIKQSSDGRKAVAAGG